MRLVIYHRYGEREAAEMETRVCNISELGAELMAIFLLYERQPLWIIFRKGVEHSEAVIIIQRKDRRAI